MTQPIDRNASFPARVVPAVKMRASDADRHATVALLQDAMARGLLTPDEGSERMGAAFAAVHRLDLEPLTADLPPAPGTPGTAPWRPQLSLLGDQLRSSLQPGAGRNWAALLGAALLLLVLLLVLGTTALHLLLDGGGFGPDHGDPRGH